MPVTLQDIAEEAGVSRSTVSRALNGQGRMTDETRNYIKSLAEEMGYSPNLLAQSLHDAKTHTIGVVITSVGDPYVQKLVEGIEEVANNAGYTILLGASKFDAEKEIETILNFYQRRVDGIIVHAAHLSASNSNRLASIDVPIVLITNMADDIGTYHHVTIDERKESMKAVDYLFAIGHRNIGYVNSPVRPYLNERRLAGYKDAHNANRQPIDVGHIIRLPTMSDFETGFRALDMILDTNVTAVFCFNDAIAIGVLNACRERGISVPDDLSIVGFDNIDQSSWIYPKLTTIHQPKFELGRQAMELIQSEATEVVDRILDCKLIVRESTRPLE